MAKRRKKLDPNRFQKQDGLGLFSFNPIRRDCIKWGAVAGAAGGAAMLFQSLLGQIAGIMLIVFISNHGISKASRLIPRWQATVLSFIGVMLALFSVIIVGTILISFYSVSGGN